MPQGVPHTQMPPRLHPMHTGSPAPHVPSACTHQNPTPSTPDPCAISNSTHVGIPVPPSPTRAPHLLPCRPTPHTRMPPTGCACSSVRSWGSTSFSVRSSSSSSARAWGPRHRQEDTLPSRCRGGAVERVWDGCGTAQGALGSLSSPQVSEGQWRGLGWMWDSTGALGSLTSPQVPGGPSRGPESCRMQALTALLLRPGPSSSSRSCTQPRERTGRPWGRGGERVGLGVWDRGCGEGAVEKGVTRGRKGMEHEVGRCGAGTVGQR